MNRVELLDKLRCVAPALSDTLLIPALSHFWFKGDQLVAYNDQIALSTSLKTEFKGAVPGSLLIELLNASRAKEVELLTQRDDKDQLLPDGELLIKAAAARLRLPYLPESATKLFEMPQPSEKHAMGLEIGPFMEAIESCLRSVREDTSIPDSLGITVIPDTNTLDLFSTNDATMSHAQVKTKGAPKFKNRVVLSGLFCRQMLELSKDKKAAQLEIHDDYALFKSGDTLLFGRLVDVERPLDFDSMLDQHFPPAAKKSMVEIPSMLQLILERAVIITDSKTDRAKTAVTIRKGSVEFFSKSDKGEVHDKMKIDPNHPDVAITIEPKLLKAGYGAFDRILITSTCAIMAKADTIYLISATQA